MDFMTKIEGCPDRGQIVPGMAYFGGTGPQGTSCSQCSFYGANRDHPRKCLKHKQMTGGEWGPNFYSQSACKYFEAKK
jgi:hypothetical protein